METPSKHYLETERQIINLMLKSKEVIDELLDDGISPDFFDPHHQPIVAAIFKEYVASDRKRLLSRPTYRQMLSEGKSGGDLMQNLSVYDKCFIVAFARPDDLGHLKKMLVEGYIGRQCFFFFQEFKKDVKDQGNFFAAKNLNDKLRQSLGITETRRTVVASLHELKEEFMKDLKWRADNKDKIVRCGIPEIDNAVNVGFRPQHLTLFVADVGGHKTNLMLNIALELYDRNHSVMFVPLEMNRIDLSMRIVSNRAEVNYNKLACPEELTKEEWKRIADCKIWLDRQNSFYILDADDRTSVSQLQHEIEKRSLAFRPDVVIVDYIANLKPDIRFGNRNDIEIGEILKSLRFLGKKHKFHIISAAQMGRAAIKAMRDDVTNVPDSTSIRGSHEYSADSDTIFGLMNVKDEPGKIKGVVIKARHGPSGGSFELAVAPEFCRITSKENLHIITSSSPESEFDMDESQESISKSLQSSPDVIFDHMSFEEDELGDTVG